VLDNVGQPTEQALAHAADYSQRSKLGLNSASLSPNEWRSRLLLCSLVVIHHISIAFNTDVLEPAEGDFTNFAVMQYF